jgi:hypothetical protein
LGGNVRAGRENKMPDVPEVESQVTFEVPNLAMEPTVGAIMSRRG